MIGEQLPALQIVLPLIAAAICMILRARRLCWTFAVAVSWLTFCTAVALLLRVHAGGTISYALGGWQPPPDHDPSEYMHTVTHGECGANGSCTEGTCQTLKVCTAPAPDPPVTGSKDEGCAGAPAEPPLWVLVALALMWGCARRRA